MDLLEDDYFLDVVAKKHVASYYKNHFPFDAIIRLAGTHTAAENVEFVSECDGQFAFKRYLSANDGKTMRAKLVTSDLKTIHIGPAYSNGVPRAGATQGGGTLHDEDYSHPCGRAFTIDLDLTDQEFLNIASSDLPACDKAWPLAAAGVFLLKYLLSEAFGLDQFLIFYSGRRGVHLWALDERAFRWSDEVRDAVARTLNFEPDQRCPASKPESRGTRASERFVEEVVERYAMWEAVRELFVEHVLDPEGVNHFGSELKILCFVNALQLTHTALEPVTLAAEASARGNGQHAFEFLERRVFQVATKATRTLFTTRWKAVVVAHVWPRIDLPVTKQVNHLIKCPFSCHASTKRICIPISYTSDLFTLDVSMVPTATDIVTDPQARQRFADVLVNWEAFVSYGHRHAEHLQSKRQERANSMDIEDLATAPVVSASSHPKRPATSSELLSAHAKRARPNDFVLHGDFWVVRVHRNWFLSIDAERRRAKVLISWSHGEEDEPCLTQTTIGQFRLKNGADAKFVRRDGAEFISHFRDLLQQIRSMPFTEFAETREAMEHTVRWLDLDVRVLKPIERYGTHEAAMRWACGLAEALGDDATVVLELDLAHASEQRLSQQLGTMYSARGGRVVRIGC